MLVLSRRRDTAIQIGRDIKVTVLSIRNRQVKLGIDAPSNVRIWRDELCRGDPRLLEHENEKINADEPGHVRQNVSLSAGAGGEPRESVYPRLLTSLKETLQPQEIPDEDS